MAIIKNKAVRLYGFSDVTGATLCTLLPGINEVPTDRWLKVRGDAKAAGHLKGDLEEIGVTEIAETKDKPSTLKFKDFKDFEMDEQERLVKDTFNLTTLEAWKKSNSKDSTRAVILNQIDVVNQEGKTGSKPTRLEG